MKEHYPYLVKQADSTYEKLCTRICIDPENDYRGAVDSGNYMLEPGSGIGMLQICCMVYSCPDSRFYRSQKALEHIHISCDMLERVMHEDGTTDFRATNFYTPSTFEIQALYRGFVCFRAYMQGTEAEKEAEKHMLHVLERLGDGCVNGGFHTPNHRWVEAAALLMLCNLMDRPDFLKKAQRYIQEGIDCDEYGEFTERSMGCYNPINVNCMLIMAAEAGLAQMNEYAQRNMELTFQYLDGDGTLFTKNSRRQDSDNDSFYPAHAWYYLYLWAGYQFKNLKYLKFADEMFWDSLLHGRGIPSGLWLYLTFPELQTLEPDFSGINIPREYHAFYPKSNILRVRKGDFTYTLIAGKPDFLYIKFGRAEMTLRMCSSFFAVAQFEPDRIEKTETGYRMRFRGHGEYKGQFETPPETSDWFKMDHSKRPVLHSCDLDYTLDVTDLSDGIRLHIVVDNTPNVPFKLEYSVPAGTRVETDQIIFDAVPNSSITIKQGDMRLENTETGCAVTVKGMFAKHMYHRQMRGSIPPRSNMYAIYSTDFSPVDRTVEFRFSKRDHARAINESL